MSNFIGNVISGSLSEGFEVKLISGLEIGFIKTGKFVSIQEGETKFFCLICDIKLETTNPEILLFPPTQNEKLLGNFLNRKDLFSVASIKPMLALDKFNRPQPVKFIPSHFAKVNEVNQEEISYIFGDEKSDKHFSIGNPLDMDVSVCLDLEKLTERSNGIFGKTGTGKTFLTRLVLAGLIKKDKAVNLIFDMHSEYGLQARKEGEGENFVKGLKTLFPSKVAIFSLDPDSTRRRGGACDVEINIPYNSVSIEDVLSLQGELNLHSTALEAAYLIASKYKKDWLSALLVKGENAKEFAEEVGAHPESIAALYRKLKRIERLPFFIQKSNSASVIDQMMEYINRGISIIVEFGNYTNSFTYLLIANILSRRIHHEYVSKTEKFLGTQRKEDEPKKLLITIEEAHKFLNPSAASQTIFGVIAREMRKYFVSLLVVDQRPSGIDQEIISQIGTKIVAQLNDEKDIQSVLNGVAGAASLRSVLSTLDSKKQALLMGHALTMPIVIETRNYDSKFYAAVSEDNFQKLNSDVEKIFT